MLIVLLILTVFCAVQALHATRLLNAALWLAAVSACVATMLYLAGAWQIAAIELSVGTGLVTVLMVFAITMVGDEQEVLSKQRLPVLLASFSVLLLIVLTVPFLPKAPLPDQRLVSDVLWQARALDLLPQIALMFAGVLGVLGLLHETSPIESTKSQDAAHEQELSEQELSEQGLSEQEAA